MKNLLPSLFVVLFISNVVGQDSSKPKQSFDLQEYVKSESERIVGLKFPAFKIKTSGSSIFSNKDLRNKVVFINFWFANCTPCIAEMAGLNKMFDKLKDNKDFIFVSFTYDSDSLTKKIIEKYNIKYKVIHINKSECKRLNFNNAFPTSFILDKNGLIKFFTAGGDIDEDNATEDVTEIFYPKILEQF